MEEPLRESPINQSINIERVNRSMTYGLRPQPGTEELLKLKESEIKEFIYEFNSFCNCLHPRYRGDYGYNKVKFDVEKDKKNFTIDVDNPNFIGILYRGKDEKNEKFFIGTMNKVSLYIYIIKLYSLKVKNMKNIKNIIILKIIIIKMKM